MAEAAKSQEAELCISFNPGGGGGRSEWSHAMSTCLDEKIIGSSKFR